MNNRREFFKSIGRHFVLIVLGLLTAAGFAFKRIDTDAGTACPTNRSCKGCGQLSSCDKEQANEYKNKTANDSGTDSSVNDKKRV